MCRNEDLVRLETMAPDTLPRHPLGCWVRRESDQIGMAGDMRTMASSAIDGATLLFGVTRDAALVKRALQARTQRVVRAERSRVTFLTSHRPCTSEIQAAQRYAGAVVWSFGHAMVAYGTVACACCVSAMHELHRFVDVGLLV